MIHILMNGCNGKMGQMITGLARQDGDVEIVAGVDKRTEIKQDYPVFEKIEQCTVGAEVIVDFSCASALDGLLSFAVAKKIPLVLCSTGHTQEQLAQIREASAKIAILQSANMSFGIHLLMKLLREAAGVLAPAGYDIELVERHHNQKMDAPSGTAIALADCMNRTLGNAYEYVYDRSGRKAKRNPKEIGISAVRGGTIVGDHEVIFAGPDEVIELKHTAYSRAVFGKGALEAAKFLAGKPAGMYDMEDVV